MDFLLAALFGAVQGLTEFLPISSSGHLVILHSITDFRVVDDLTFDLALHMGTLLALVAVFHGDLLRVLRAGWQSLTRRPGPDDSGLFWQLIVGTIPAAVFGYLLEDLATTAFRSVTLVAVTLVAAGIGLWAIDRWRPRDATLDRMTLGKAGLIGVGQAIALVPGISRSGATMMFGRLFGLTREAAARFSFLLAIPITFGAGLKKLSGLRAGELIGHEIELFVIGFLSSALVGFAAIKLLLRYLSRHSYAIFAVYRIVIGLVLLASRWF